MNRPTWVTNDPEAARALAAADKAFERAKVAAGRAPTLAAKVDALRAAKEARRAAYDAAMGKPMSCACGQVPDCARFPLGSLVVPPRVVCDVTGSTPVMHTTRGCRPWVFTPHVTPQVAPQVAPHVGGEE